MTEGGGESTYTTREQVFNTAVLDSSLKRGTSTKKDVEQALGRPGGFGQCFLPTDSEPKTVWFYERVEVKTYGRNVSEKQDILLVFLKGDVFDGFMWFSDNQPAK